MEWNPKFQNRWLNCRPPPIDGLILECSCAVNNRGRFTGDPRGNQGAPFTRGRAMKSSGS